MRVCDRCRSDKDISSDIRVSFYFVIGSVPSPLVPDIERRPNNWSAFADLCSDCRWQLNKLINDWWTS